MKEEAELKDFFVALKELFMVIAELVGDVGGVLIATVILGILLSTSVIISGWVLKTLWGWFVVPTFGLPALKLPSAIGLSVLVDFLTFHSSPKSKESSTEILTRFLTHTILTPLIVIGIGWVAHLFM